MAKLTVAQVAELCNVTPATVRNWIRRDKVKRLGGGLLDSVEVLEWWNKRDHDMAELRRAGTPLPEHRRRTPRVSRE